MLQFDELIKQKYDKLSPRQKKAADYMFENLENATFQTAVQIGLEANVSDSTVIRLSYALGFRSFSEMQETIRRHFLESVNPLFKKDELEAVADEINPFAAILENEITALKRLAHQMDVSKIWQAVDALIQADQVLVMGYYSAYAVATEFRLRLSAMRPEVVFYRTGMDEFHRLFDLTNQSVVVAFSFPKHPKDTLDFTRQAKERGAIIISITDGQLSPIARESNIAINVDLNIDKETGFLVLSPAMTVISLILMGYKMRNREQVLHRLKNMEH